jgi:hypothetical protein
VKPVLVCGDSWVIRQSMSDQALKLDAAGRAVPVSGTFGRPERISDFPEYQNKKRAAADLRKEEAFPVSHYPKN